MSKRQSNTILSYFKSPKPIKSDLDKSGSENGGQATPVKSKEVNEHQEKPSNQTPKKQNVQVRSGDESSKDEEEVVMPKKRSRIKVFDDSSDSDDENPPKRSHIELKKTKKVSKKSKEQTLNAESDDTHFKTVLKEFSFQKTNSSNNVEKKEIHSQQKPKEIIPEVTDTHSNWLHNKLEFLRADKIRDINRRKPDDPEYDPRTVYVPESYLKDLTPAMRQWWELKSYHMDSVLFFKVGKFYELYHMDAVVGVQELGFSYMKGDFAHSGFPESAYAKMAGSLIDKGFKVARVEQTETPEMMAARCKSMVKSTKFDKVVKREICQLSSKATCVYTAQMLEPINPTSVYLYAICMKLSPSGIPQLGMCFVETSIGTFFLTQFDDDKHLSRLLALFAEYPPAMMLIERGGGNKRFYEILTCHFKDIPKEKLSFKTQFYTACDTLEKLSRACYFQDGEGNFHWPEFFKTVADDCFPKPHAELSIRSLGACMWYLEYSKIDVQVLSLGKFEWYNPLDLISEKQQDEIKNPVKDYLILDSVTMAHLDLLGGKGSLQYTLDHCETAFGKRLLQRWICRPLCHVEKIRERQKAISVLFNNPTLLQSAKAIMNKMPDLERQLTKIHSYGNKFLAADHPDSRAIFYEAVTYSKRKIKDFLKTLRALEKAQEIPDVFDGCEDRFLKKITQFSPVGVNVDLKSTLDFFKTAFDQKQAEVDGKIIPKSGVVEEYDEVEETIKEITKDSEVYLKEQSRFFGCQVKYVTITDKKRFYLEVPDDKNHRATNEYLLEGTKKGKNPTKRFSTSKTREFLAAMLKAEGERAKIILDLNRRIFEKFSENYEQLDQVIQCLTILDVLCSLAEYARRYSLDLCIPDVLPFAEEPKLIIENGHHPCIMNIDNFVPNDTKMGVDNFARLLIITGPNMGGKSTLMRQIALISIMAQMGCFVPASKCQITLIDRVFTRIGAQDDIVQGHSTFYNELSEAACILQHATVHSLLLIDELGRGTSTHDGNAIASAYVKKLTKMKCRTTFSTHYHSLVDSFIGLPEVQLGHMACMVENDDDPTQESVTFLYKMAEGTCPKSYGFNVAKLAGLNKSIIVRARQVSKEFEEKSNLRDSFRTILTTKDMSLIRNLLASLSMNSD
ncbi:hypothetical protein JTB14_002909 [Gonioctena quinquepunctata]|nr:hypothetical protein JTB14_002909 [Gonioctena quinquepunctata]